MGEPILIVEDDEVLGRILSRVLQGFGYATLHATTLDSAIRLAREHSSHLALIDLCLPDGDGREVARRLREERPGTTCILMTAYPLRLSEHPEFLDDFARVLFKPLDLAELREAIQDGIHCARETFLAPGA